MTKGLKWWFSDEIKKTICLENPGIDPGTSRMQSGRSNFCAKTPSNSMSWMTFCNFKTRPSWKKNPGFEMIPEEWNTCNLSYVFSRKEIGGGRPWRAFPFVRYLNMFRPERFRSLANFELENGYGFCLQSAYMTMILKGISRTSQQVCLLKSKCIRKRSTKTESFKLMFQENLTNF